MNQSAGRRNKLNDTCSSFLLMMFLFCAFLLFFTYTDTLSNANDTLHLQNIFFTDFNTDDTKFAVQRYTWKCQDKKCVKSVADEEEVSLNSCNMLCSQPAIWPKPANLEITNKDSSIVDKTKILFDFAGEGLVQLMLQNTTDLFKKNLDVLKPGNQSTPGVELNINIILSDARNDKLRLDTNESYQLTVQKNNTLIVNISAENYFGARHALETLSQLIWYDEVINELRILQDVDIVDSPKFPYRGLMVDTARNYFPMPLIKKVVDGMAMSKLNVLHLHLTDSVSFPVVLPKAKQLAAFGAYGSDMIYTADDIKDLVEYALIRGIRVLLEVDAPGHVNAGWNSAKNRLNQKYVICGEDNIDNGHLNPDNDDALQMLEDIYSDLLELAGDNEIFHIGGDEVNLTCWQNTDAVRNLKRQEPMTKFWAGYTNQMLERLKIANNYVYPDHIVLWSSKLTESSYLAELTVKVTVQFWLGNPTGILSQGHKVIYSTVGHWYLDCGFNVWRPSMRNGNCDPYTPWQTFYKYRPWVEYGHSELVLGGEVTLFAEQVEVDDLETRIWPRSAAFAERVWSDPDVMDNYDVYTRLVSFSDRLKSRGVKTAGIWPRWCSQNPGKC